MLENKSADASFGSKIGWSLRWWGIDVNVTYLLHVINYFYSYHKKPWEPCILWWMQGEACTGRAWKWGTVLPQYISILLTWSCGQLWDVFIPQNWGLPGWPEIKSLVAERKFPRWWWQPVLLQMNPVWCKLKIRLDLRLDRRMNYSIPSAENNFIPSGGGKYLQLVVRAFKWEDGGTVCTDIVAANGVVI